MSKYSHFEMCEKIFGDRYKWDEHKQECTLFTRSDMWDKLVEQQQQIAELQKQLKEKEKYTYTGKEVGEIERKYDEKIDTLEQQLKSQPAEIVEKIREFCLTDHKFKECEIYLREDNGQTIYSFLDDILKEYQK